MHNLSLIEECYKKFIKELYLWAPEGIYFVNLDLLHQFDLLHFQPNSFSQNSLLTHYFHVFESPEKITLINNEFVIWIIPAKAEHTSLTYALIALNPRHREPQLEVAFIASGVYNTSSLVLKILEKFLIDIQETEKVLAQFQEASD